VAVHAADGRTDGRSFLVGGFASADFADRLTTPAGIGFVGGWLQMLSFAAVVVCGTATLRRSER